MPSRPGSATPAAAGKAPARRDPRGRLTPARVTIVAPGTAGTARGRGCPRGGSAGRGAAVRRTFPAYAELIENLKQWYAEPPTVEYMTVIGSYQLF